jgi:hypothetical protein
VDVEQVLSYLGVVTFAITGALTDELQLWLPIAVGALVCSPPTIGCPPDGCSTPSTR